MGTADNISKMFFASGSLLFILGFLPDLLLLYFFLTIKKGAYIYLITNIKAQHDAQNMGMEMHITTAGTQIITLYIRLTS